MVNKIIKNTYLNIRQNIKNLSDIYKRFHDIERQKTYSNSLIFLKRSVNKLLLIEKNISDINLDKDFETKNQDTDEKDLKSCLALRNSILEKVYWFKASNSECTKFGCRQFNKFNERNYNKDWDKKPDAPNIETYLANKKKTPFKVNKIQAYSEQ